MSAAQGSLEDPRALLRRLPRPVQALVAGTFVNRAGSFILPFLSLVLSRELALPAGQVAVWMAAYGAGSLVSMMLGGVLTDTLGRRRTMLLSMFGGGVLALGMALAPDASTFVPLLLAFSLLTDLYRPASSALLGDLLPSVDRSVGYAALRMAANLGFFFGMGFGGVLVDHSYRLMFALDGLTTIASGVLIFRAVPETRGATPAGGAAEGSSPTNPLRDLPFLLSCAGAFLLALSFHTGFIILPLTITRGAGYPALVFGLLVGLNGLFIALIEVTATAWLRRYRRLRVAALGALLTGIGFGGVGLWMHWGWFLITTLLWTAGEILAAPQHMAFASDWAPPAARGRYLSLHSANWSLSATISPALLLPLHERLGDARFWPLLMILLLPNAGVYLLLDRRFDHPARLRGRS